MSGLIAKRTIDVLDFRIFHINSSCMAERHMFSKQQQTVAAVPKNSLMEFYMHCIICDFRDLPEIHL
jgi:hypothetical protein